MSRPPRPAIDRFLEKVMPEPNTGCWLWLSTLDKDGYAMFFNRRHLTYRAQRFSYEHFVGPVPGGLVLDHLCRNRGCVNPAHLEPVTNRENIVRGFSPLRERTHCLHDHEFTPENTLRTPGQRGRKCRTCHRLQERERRQLRRAA